MSALFFVKKEGGVLSFSDYGGCEQRNPSTIWMIQRADEIYKWDDFKTIAVQTDDEYNAVTFQGIETYCSYTKKNTFENLVPDFLFTAWPDANIIDYTTAIISVHEAGLKPAPIFKVGWVGQIQTKRERFLEIGKTNPDLFDFFDRKTVPFTPLTEQVAKYAILVDIEGAGYSARLKLLLWSHRPVLLIDRPDKEFFFEYLVAWEHYIPVKRDLSDLVEKTKWCMEHCEEAQKIAEAAFVFASRYLTREAACKQWNAVITGTKVEF